MSTLGTIGKKQEMTHCKQCNRTHNETPWEHTVKHHPSRIIGVVCAVLAVAMGVALVVL